MSNENCSKLIEQGGWLQGKVISGKYCEELLKLAIKIDVDLETLKPREYVLIVATQSCNLANSAVNSAQLCIGRKIGNTNPAFEYNKHPRILDSYYVEVTETETLQQSMRINILEKVFVQKELLLSFRFNDDILFGTQELKSFVDWLGCHYTKPALPTSFNALLDSGKQKRKRKLEKNLSHDFSGIYVKLFPNTELAPDEKYQVQLLGILVENSDATRAKLAMDNFVSYFQEVGIEVNAAVNRLPSQVNLAVIKDFSRLYLDDLTYRENGELPIEIEVNL
ncbi:hypothetical protein QX776_11005 [Alteromonadaceae bacterium BrNp21-10]|nr:hypothetical protein [Alteromonadaceae bacterium BrNp21-10]